MKWLLNSVSDGAVVYAVKLSEEDVVRAPCIVLYCL